MLKQLLIVSLDIVHYEVDLRQLPLTYVYSVDQALVILSAFS